MLYERHQHAPETICCVEGNDKISCETLQHIDRHTIESISCERLPHRLEAMYAWNQTDLALP